jgi:hypothetical protein
MQEAANAGLGDAIKECEDHLAKLNHINEALRESHSDNTKQAVSIYVATLDDWFKERLITRAKLNARGGVFDAADQLDVKTLDSLVTFYSEAKAILAEEDPAALSNVGSTLQKYGFYRRVLQKLESEQEAAYGKPPQVPQPPP